MGRRGKPSTWLPSQKLAEERILAPPRNFLTTMRFLEDSWLDLRILHFFKIFKISRPHNISARHGITRAIVYAWSWGFASASRQFVSRGHMFYIENELRKFPGERKIHSKVTVNCRPSITVFFLPGVLLMSNGAVNRQPGHRAGNLRRRGLTHWLKWPTYSLRIELILSRNLSWKGF